MDDLVVRGCIFRRRLRAHVRYLDHQASQPAVAAMLVFRAYSRNSGFNRLAQVAEDGLDRFEKLRREVVRTLVPPGYIDQTRQGDCRIVLWWDPLGPDAAYPLDCLQSAGFARWLGKKIRFNGHGRLSFGERRPAIQAASNFSTPLMCSQRRDRDESPCTKRRTSKRRVSCYWEICRRSRAEVRRTAGLTRRHRVAGHRPGYVVARF